VMVMKPLASLGVIFLVTVAAAGEDPDALYRQREDLANASRAAQIWSTTAADDYEAAWKLARAAYWIGGHAPEGERRAALERGITAGEAAIRLGPDRPEGHYWLAADMGALAESFGLSQGLKYRSRIKSELERVLAIAPAWEQASGVTALGRWYSRVPRLFGGSRAKADEHFRRTLQQFPTSITALLFLAESLTEQHKTAEARQLLQQVIDAPIEPEWAPEDRDFKRQAAEQLRAFAGGDKKP
jgi:tetratricopeptide (TPR) repeat protein